MDKIRKVIGLLVFIVAFCMGIVVTPETAKADIMQELKFDEKYALKWNDYLGEEVIYNFDANLLNSGKMSLKFFSNDNTGDLQVRIYDSTGTRIYRKYYTGTFKADVDLKAGQYSIIISNSLYETSGVLEVSFADSKESYKENAIDTNNQVGAASKIKSVKKTNLKGQIAINDTSDFYKFKVANDSKLNITFKSELKNVELCVFDDELNYKAQYDIVAGTNKFTANLPKGNYYISIINREEDVTGNYTLKLSTSSFKKATIKNLKSTEKKKAKVTWKKISSIDGYQIQIATNSKFTKGKKSYTTTKTSYTVKKLKSKKNYYVRIRTYTVSENGKKCYSTWSKVRKVKIK